MMINNIIIKQKIALFSYHVNNQQSMKKYNTNSHDYHYSDTETSNKTHHIERIRCTRYDNIDIIKIYMKMMIHSNAIILSSSFCNQ